jgi:glutaredoxin-like protein NrdH
MLTVYTQPNCVHCDATKHYLRTEGIPFEEKNIRESADAFQTVVELGYRGVPVVVTEDGQHWNGMKKDRLDEVRAKFIASRQK